MTEAPRYNLLNIIQLIFKNYRKIFVFTLLAAVAGALMYFIIPKKYDAETVFILKNPLYADRNNLYNNETKFLDYAANDEDIDRLIAMASSDSLQNTVIRAMHLATAYQYDTTDLRQMQKLKKCFKNHLKIYRNDYRNVVLRYTDKDANRAAEVANFSASLLEYSLRDFYNSMRKSMYLSIVSRIYEEDSAIQVLTDTLTALREKYGIYDIISPARYNIMLSTMKENGRPGFARGIELIQNIESVKDELVSDRAKHITLANQYATGTQINEMTLTHVIQVATPPLKPAGLGLIGAILFGGLLGFLFGLLYVLLSDHFRANYK